MDSTTITRTISPAETKNEPAPEMRFLKSVMRVSIFLGRPQGSASGDRRIVQRLEARPRPWQEWFTKRTKRVILMGVDGTGPPAGDDRSS